MSGDFPVFDVDRVAKVVNGCCQVGDMRTLVFPVVFIPCPLVWEEEPITFRRAYVRRSELMVQSPWPGSDVGPEMACQNRVSGGE
jgi:hypothetical protein